MAIHVESCLRRAGLWDEVKDDLHTKQGTDLSGGQQQRLCVAGALANKPDVLLMDEPTESIDPIATAKIENLMVELKQDRAVVISTHSMAEARGIAGRVAYFHLVKLPEIAPTEALFPDPQTKEARALVEGKMG